MNSAKQQPLLFRFTQMSRPSEHLRRHLVISSHLFSSVALPLATSVTVATLSLNMRIYLLQVVEKQQTWWLSANILIILARISSRPNICTQQRADELSTIHSFWLQLSLDPEPLYICHLLRNEPIPSSLLMDPEKDWSLPRRETTELNWAETLSGSFEWIKVESTNLWA